VIPYLWPAKAKTHICRDGKCSKSPAKPVGFKDKKPGKNRFAD
jgi:hypothetical protein